MKHIDNICLDPIRQYVQRAVDEVYKNDKSLIVRDVNERSIVFRFGLYLYEILKFTEFKDFDIDVEYNRNGNDIKRIPSRPNGSFPDLIIHKRGVNTDNLLVVEFKTEWSNQTQQDDVKKIRDFMNKEGKYKFRYGATILIGRDKPHIEWF